MSSKNENKRLARECYSGKLAQTILQENSLAGFDELWNLNAPWFEAPNERREGLSGVVTWDLSGPDGQVWPVFIKRQHNHNTRTYRKPFKGEPTFCREYRNIVRAAAIGVPTVDVLYYGEQHSSDGTRAILVSRALTGYVSLEDWFNSPESEDEATSTEILRQVVDAIKPMHQHWIRHGCLYGKHLLIKQLAPQAEGLNNLAFDVRLLDFEKAHFSAFKNRIIVRDLSQLLRHSGAAFRSHASSLILLYFGAARQQYWLSRLEKQMQGKTK